MNDLTGNRLNITPSISNFGPILLLRGNLLGGVLGDGVCVRHEDRVVRRVQEHAVTRGLRNWINDKLGNHAFHVLFTSR